MAELPKGFGRRNVHCSNCGDERGGPFGHETREHADATHDCGEFKGKSSIEEEAAPVEVVAEAAACTCPLHASLMQGYNTDCPPDAPRPTFTLADMEEASAAVRARRVVRGRVEPDGPIHPGPGTFLPLGQVYLRPGAEPQAYWPDPSVTFAVDVSADGSSMAIQDSDGHVHLVESAPPVDAALEPDEARETTPAQLARHVTLRTYSIECGAMTEVHDCRGCDGQAVDGLSACLHACHEPAPWWRRMLGGGTR